MPRDNTSSTNRCPRLFTGYAIMIMGMMNLFTSDPGDVNNNLGTMLLPFGLLVESEYEQLRRTERRLSSRHGRRGPYKTARTNEFIDNILDNGSEQYSRVGFTWTDLRSLGSSRSFKMIRSLRALDESPRSPQSTS
ncbi:hypothetical protein FRC08_007766 [Ceratobasidium sp. 394]|nr:hypothetical protein FRC08_007766 [Ceratobasidium sp. 394]KAG9075340.1 hypothetical protein FS749_012998 [Ceratobasidium sp. UAMH 11750]